MVRRPLCAGSSSCRAPAGRPGPSGSATTAQPRDDIERPVAELLWPNFAAGRLAINWQSFVEDRPAGERDRSAHAWNLGEKLGLTGLTSLVPLIAMWSVVAGLYAWRNGREEPSG